ncbi:MAG: hypothetical protein GWN61_05395, partial [candidate division Zixibacteria bacterium]|nr:VCBS repeat-containing protein [Phycisphaerae bacterium]NIR63512.1 VCBS repeat-containing protein [candidate division Zixibacteria bacterium]NIT70687.1 VCBS repeat-containing protein [candidate division KSB1 bacterium]NIW44457.1 hypothetical protein [Gammaproteobacteria bacterium]NIS45465.1 VCBS repeat-containing protein [candidate division Zixibacteria bacterium]
MRKFRATRYGGLGAADVNNDSYCDLVTYDGGSFDYEEWGTTVYLNNGDVTFTRLCQDTIGSPDFALADFNGDNFTDIAVFNDDYYVPENRSIWIYSGLGDGNFAAPIILEPSATGGPKAGDVNDDGVVDLLFSIDYYPYCRLNNGDGTFADPISIHEGTNLGDLIEMNGDRYPDLFYAQTYGCVPRPAFRIGNGDGTFGPHQVAWTTAGLLSGINLAVADFNYDGHVDIALTAPENNFVDVGLNDGRMDFERFHDETIPLPTAGPMVTADFDGDGDYDLAVIEKSGRENDTLAIAFSTGAQHERTIIVPDDHLTVQDAVDYAWNLDTIFVCPGIYRECIDFDG